MMTASVNSTSSWTKTCKNCFYIIIFIQERIRIGILTKFIFIFLPVALSCLDFFDLEGAEQNLESYT